MSVTVKHRGPGPERGIRTDIQTDGVSDRRTDRCTDRRTDGDESDPRRISRLGPTQKIFDAKICLFFQIEKKKMKTKNSNYTKPNNSFQHVHWLS